MEESQASGATLAATSSNGPILAAHLGREAVMNSEGLGHKDGEPKWETSPERTTSLLPPFGVGQPLAHLPTPQSPGDLTNYFSGPDRSPLSIEHSRPCHNRYSSSHRPPSRLTGAKTPQPSQRGTSSFKTPPVFSVSKELKDSSRSKDNSLLEEIEFSRVSTSQVATPSPELSRTRRASVPRTFSDTETLLATPQPGRRSSSHPYTVPTSLAPAPIISPANSSHSTTYHASPDYEASKPKASLSYDISYNMSAPASEHRVQVGLRVQGDYDLDDPFIDRDDDRRGEALSRQRYISLPPKMHQEHCATDASISSLQNTKAGRKSPIESSIAKLLMSPSESSDVPLHGSPVKSEVDDGHFMTMEPSLLHPIDKRTPSRTPISPRTPPRASSSRASVSEPHTSTLADSSFRIPPPFSGGEIERIRQRQAQVEKTRVVESEKRRPDYLTRIKRARDSIDEEAAEREREIALPGLGVTVSPFRGRRLKLYQPVAVASNATNVVVLEEPATETDEPTEPKTPPPINTLPSWQTLVPSMSIRAIDWHTPRRDRSSPVAWTEEDERRKQRRLQAFAAQEPSGKGRRLKPAKLVGQGRVIIDITSKESRKLAADGMLQVLETNSVEDTQSSLSYGVEWPDNEHPWSVQERQRDEYGEAWRRQRLTWIERFLDRESESEDEENECVPGPSTRNQTYDSGSIPRPQGGHGKTISINANPSSKSRSVRRMTFNAANTDAREVLLSKKHVRAVVERLRRRRIAEEEEGVVMCICQGADDGRPMVRCDECRTWYHLICMDIHDESELGDEWYCWKCLPSAEDPSPPPPTEPTFAPAMPDSPPRAGVGDQPLYQSALPTSPMPASPVRCRKAERSPTRRSGLPQSSLGDPGDPVRSGPSTPYRSQASDSRLYSTPKLYDEYGVDDHAPFDPTSTPSRGLKFPNPVPVTPRRPQPWSVPAPLSWMTPSGLPQTPQFSAQSGSSSNRSMAYSFSTLEDSVGPLTSPWPTEDSPTRKSHKGTDLSWPYPTSRRVLDSPLAGPDHRPFLPGVDESPTPRPFHKGKDTEFMFRAGHSPHRDRD